MRRIVWLILIVGLLVPLKVVFCAEKDSDADYLEYFYTRYSRNFDKYGLKMAVPDYGIKNFTLTKTGREIISLSGYYKYRALAGEKKAQEILAKELKRGIQVLHKQPDKALSFNEAEALFLAVRLIEQVPELLTLAEQDNLSQLIKKKLGPGISAKDTENRAIIAGAHWQFLTNWLAEKNLLIAEEKSNFDRLIKEKIDAAIKTSVSTAGWYREKNQVVPHYQAVTAFMLLAYSQESGLKDYAVLAEKMYLNLKRLSFQNGMVEAQIGHRPVGLGAQFYLMMAILGESAKDEDWPVYVNYASGNRFFSDANRPNRLEYHRTSQIMKGITSSYWYKKKKYYKTTYQAVKQSANYHDDYAFIDAGEWALLLGWPAGEKLPEKTVLANPLNYSDDGELQISNAGLAIGIFDWKRRTKISLEMKNNRAVLKKQEKAAPLFSAVKSAVLWPDEFLGAKITTPVAAYALADESGQLLAGKNWEKKMPSASLTKMMAAAVFLENRQKDWSDLLVYNAKRHFVYGNYLNLHNGDSLTVRDIFYSLLVGSVNEMGEMLVDATGLTREQFVIAMNQKATGMGLTRTNFVDPSGFSEKNTSTAAEQLKILSMVYNLPEAAAALSVSRYQFEMTNNRGKIVKHSFLHTNPLLRRETSFQVLASKTGYLDESQRCLAQVVEKNGRQYFFVTLANPNPDKHEKNTELLVNRLIAPLNLASGQ